MGRRLEPLIPLTHDHHHVLRHVRALRSAADRGEGTALADAARSFLAFYEREMLVHFREEEERLLPMLPLGNAEARELVTRTLVEHVQIHALLRDLRRGLDAGTPDPLVARDVAETVRRHVRMEEDTLFPLVERIVPGPELAELRLADRVRTAEAPLPGASQSPGEER